MMRIAGIDSLPCTDSTLLARRPFESALPVSHRALPVRISSRPIRPSRPASVAVTLPGRNAPLPASIQAPSVAVVPLSPTLPLRSTPVSLQCARPGPSDQLSKMTSQRLCLTRMMSAISPLLFRAAAPSQPILRVVGPNPLRRALVRLEAPMVSLASVAGTSLVLGPIHSVSLGASRHPNHLRPTGTIIVHRSDCLSMTVFSPPPAPLDFDP